MLTNTRGVSTSLYAARRRTLLFAQYGLVVIIWTAVLLVQALG
jgi:hypothetical protein